MPRVKKSKKFLVQALGFPSIKGGGSEPLNSSEMHVPPWVSKILCGVRLFVPTETVNTMPLLAGTRPSLAHPFILLVLCHHFPGGCTASFQGFDSGLPEGSSGKDMPPFCCLWLCDYLLSLAVRSKLLGEQSQRWQVVGS